MKTTKTTKRAESKKKPTTKKKSSKKDIFQVELRNVKLSKKSKASLKKIKDLTWGNIANAIECGNWWVPSSTHEFIDVKTDFEKSMFSFFNLPEDAIVEIDCYDSGIMSFEKGVYPKWHR